MQLSNKLQDIISNIKIYSSSFSISHDSINYINNSIEIVKEIQKMPPEIQFQYLNTQLSELLYRKYFDGSNHIEKKPEIKTNTQLLKEIASCEIDWEFYEQLELNNQGRGFFHPSFHMMKQELDGSVAAYFDQFILHVQPEIHLPVAQKYATVNDRITPKLPSSFINEENYRANGDYLGNLSSESSEKDAVFVYFNFTSEIAVNAMKLITQKLNENQIPFFFEVLHNPLNYGRYKSGFLNFCSYHYEEFILPLLKIIYTENKSQFQAQIPLFTKEIAPGIGLAEHPIPELGGRFGKNRCQILANALLEAHKNGEESQQSRIKYIIQHFESVGIDFERPYLNPNNEDIYTPLELFSSVKY